MAHKPEWFGESLEQRDYDKMWAERGGLDPTPWRHRGPVGGFLAGAATFRRNARSLGGPQGGAAGRGSQPGTPPFLSAGAENRVESQGEWTWRGVLQVE